MSLGRSYFLIDPLTFYDLLDRQIDIPQHPEFLVLPIEHGCGRADADYAQHDVGIEQPPECHANLVY